MSVLLLHRLTNEILQLEEDVKIIFEIMLFLEQHGFDNRPEASITANVVETVPVIMS